MIHEYTNINWHILVFKVAIKQAGFFWSFAVYFCKAYLLKNNAQQYPNSLYYRTTNKYKIFINMTGFTFSTAVPENEGKNSWYFYFFGFSLVNQSSSAFDLFTRDTQLRIYIIIRILKRQTRVIINLRKAIFTFFSVSLETVNFLELYIYIYIFVN